MSKYINFSRSEVNEDHVKESTISEAENIVYVLSGKIKMCALSELLHFHPENDVTYLI